MHILNLTAPLHVGGSIGTLTPGDWLLSDQNSFELALMAERGTATLDRGENTEPKVLTLSPGNTSILLMRSGAIGDLLFLTPAVSALRKKYPGVDIGLCCRKEHHILFSGTKTFDYLADYPLNCKNNWQYNNLFSLENLMESSTEHATDAFAKALGVTVTDYKPVFALTDDEKAKAKLIMTGTRPRVGMQLKASTANRNYPLPQWMEIILGLENRGWEVFLFGTTGQVPPIPPELQRPFVHDMSKGGLTLRETAALLSQCNAFVGIDSALIHLCHALDVPAIGLYGPFSWESRTGKAPLTRALSGTGECANCRWHAKNGQQFPPMPCRQTQTCSVLASISPERVIAKVDALKPHV